MAQRCFPTSSAELTDCSQVDLRCGSAGDSPSQTSIRRCQLDDKLTFMTTLNQRLLLRASRAVWCLVITAAWVIAAVAAQPDAGHLPPSKPRWQMPAAAETELPYNQRPI